MVETTGTFAELPDPGQAGTLDDLVDRLRLLKVWAGNPSYETIKDRINAEWTAAGRPAAELARKNTVADCFRAGRRRLNADLVEAVVRALHPDAGYVTLWRQALRVIGGETTAAAQVRVQDTLPADLTGFTGRAAELDRLRQAVHPSTSSGGAVVISAMEGMAGVGKTQLAVHAGHVLARENPFDRVLFVNLRGFHPDPAQPPADPAAVLGCFLHLLDVPGDRIPHDPAARAAAYRDRLAGTRTLVILDNAATVDQVRPLLPGTPGCTTLITSRRSLTGLDEAMRLTVDVFTPDEAVAFLSQAARGIEVGPDADAPLRIARRCGYLPLALGLVAGHMATTPGWTLTDHADRLDERHRHRRLDTGVELALDLSYQHLPADRRRLLRLLALHPGQDFDAHAAAALADTGLTTATDCLRHLGRDHLLQQSAPGRYTFHDLVRAYAAVRTGDEDRSTDRRAALTRLFDYYLATASAAMDRLFPAEAHRRPRVPPTATPSPDLPGPDTAKAWLDTERPALVAVAGHTAAHGWPTHATRLSATLFRYLDSGHFADALAVHGHARHAAQHTGDPGGQADALTNLGGVHLQVGRYESAAEYFQQALPLFRQVGDPMGQARALSNLSILEERLGRFRSAAGRLEKAVALYREAGDRVGEAWTLSNLGAVEMRLGRHEAAAEHFGQALALCRRAGDRLGEADALTNLGDLEVLQGLHGPAAGHLQQGLALYRQLGNRFGEAWTLDSLGTLHTRLGRPAEAAEFHQRALDFFREIDDRDGEAWALNGLGEAALAEGRSADAVAHHTAALAIAADLGGRDQQARAHTGLGHAHRALADSGSARTHYRHALTFYTDLGMPQAGQVREWLTAVGTP